MSKNQIHKKKRNKVFIEPLEQRIMLDGAGASTFLDLIDERSQSDNSNKSIHEVKKFKEIKSENGSKELPFTNVPRDQLKRKQIVFIDKQVPDYEKLAKSFRKNVEIHFIESNQDGFKKIEQTLEMEKNIQQYTSSVTVVLGKFYLEMHFLQMKVLKITNQL